MAPTPIVCPYCNTRLRLPPSNGRSKRVKCRACKNSFYPMVVLGSAEAPETALPELPPPPRVESGPATFPAVPAAEAPAVVTAAPPEPAEVAAEPPPDEAAPEDRPSRRERRAAAAARRRSRHKQKETMPRLRPYEAGLALALIVGISLGLGAVLWRLYSGENPNYAPATEVSGERTQPFTEPPAALPPVDRPPLPLPRRLCGIWDLKSDDGRVGRLEFRADGTMSGAVPAAVAVALFGSEVPEYRAAWALMEEDGDRLTIELSQDRTFIGGHRIVLALTCPEGFTLVESIHNGKVNREAQRFVLRVPPPAPSPPLPGP
jgi:hypothetical protein